MNMEMVGGMLSKSLTIISIGKNTVGVFAAIMFMAGVALFKAVM